MEQVQGLDRSAGLTESLLPGAMLAASGPLPPPPALAACTFNSFTWDRAHPSHAQ